MNEKSRTEYSFLNVSAAIVSNLIGSVLGFVNRIVLTHTLSATYVGVNGLFLEFLTLLSFSELGISAAMSFSLYRPLAEHNLSLLQELLTYFKKLFYIIGAVIFCIGLFLIPAFPLLIKHGDNIPHLHLIYLIYLTTNVLSYPLLYKRTLLVADQKEYKLMKYLIGAQVVQYTFQIIILLTVGDFTLYVLAGCIPTLVANILSARMVNRLYPFLKDAPLSTGFKKDINHYIFATTLQKVGTVLINNTDILILSSIISVVSVAQYSNYNLFCRGVDMILASLFKGIINSVGNLNASHSTDNHIYKVFNTTFFINQWLYGFSTICLYELLSPFVALCFGETYLLPNVVVLILCLNVFTKGLRLTAQTFHDSMGLYWYDRYRTLIEAGINLAVSIILAKYIGIAGVFIGTLLSHLLTTFWIEPYILYREGFHTTVGAYFTRYGVYFIVFVFAWVVTDVVCGMFDQIFLRMLLCVIIPNVLFILIYFRTVEYSSMLSICKSFYKICREKL